MIKKTYILENTTEKQLMEMLKDLEDIEVDGNLLSYETFPVDPYLIENSYQKPCRRGK